MAIILIGSLFVIPGAFVHKAEARVYPGVSIIVTGSTTTSVNSTYSYNITVAGGPAMDGGIYQYHAYMIGNNLTANNVNPVNGSSTTGNFHISVTMPALPETVTLIITANSTLGNITKNGTEQLKINVINPLRIVATLYNNGDISFYNIVAYYYLDNKTIGNTTVTFLGVHETAKVYYNYTIATLTPGYHSIKIVVNNPLLLFSNGKSYEYINFYVPAPAQNYTTIYLITGISITVAIILIIVFYFSNKKKGKSTKKW